jgi:hypothetical protein
MKKRASITDRWAESNPHLRMEQAECFKCRHYGGGVCLAFPDGIPDPIITMVVPHREPYPGDNGVQFEEA